MTDSISEMIDIIYRALSGNDRIKVTSTPITPATNPIIMLQSVGASDIPTTLNFYPVSFERKTGMLDYLNKYNADFMRITPTTFNVILPSASNTRRHSSCVEFSLKLDNDGSVKRITIGANSMFGMGTSNFTQLLNNSDYVKSQYD